MVTSTQSFQFANLGGNSSSFVAKGGKCGLTASGTITSVQLQNLSNDGPTFVNVGSALTAAGFANFDLPPGTYRFAITGSAVFVELTSVPT